MKHSSAFLAALLILGSSVLAVQNSHGSDDGRGLHRQADKDSVTISGVSSGAAMAVQYAVANSASIAGVGTIAGPAWGCAGGKFSTALDGCMCGRQAVDSRFSDAVKMAHGGALEMFDAMDPHTGKPKALLRSYVFHSPADITVVKESGQTSSRFLRDFTGQSPKEDRGNKSDHSNQAGHGILSPYGTDSCPVNGKETSYVRNCRKHDNAGRLFRELYGKVSPEKSRMKMPGTIFEVWEFNQQALIDEMRKDPRTNPIVASDMYPPPQHSEQRKNFDLAGTGYLYVPSACRSGQRQCRVHIALHGCKQDPRTFAVQAGYNYWAEKYDVIVVYPAVQAYRPKDLDESQICRISKQWTPDEWKIFDASWAEANYNGCWDWWGYLDLGDENLEGTKTRYLTKQGPQMQVIKKIIDAVTLPARQG